VPGEGIWSIQAPTNTPAPGGDGAVFPFDLRVICHREKEAFIREVLRIIDRPLPHVLVQIRVVENLYTNSFELGGEATHDVSGVEDTFYTGFTQTFNPPAFLSSQVESTVFQGMTLDFAAVGDAVIQRGPASGKLRIAAGRDDTWIISSSQLLVALGETGKLNAGESVPYQTITALVGTTQVTTDFKQTGVQIEFVPIAIGNDNVILRLDSSVTRVTGFTNQGGVSNPVLSTRSASTTVQLGDGQDYTFGGLVATREFVDHSKIPLLGDIPVLGVLFRSFSKRLERREVLFMIRPYIVPLQHGIVPDAVIPGPGS
jgi:type II secretory pathway component GspD/PulD (secretin)